MASPTIRLFLDKKSLSLTHETASLRWFVANEGESVLRNVQVNLRKCNEHPELELLTSNCRADIPTASGGLLEASSGLKVRESLRCALEVEVRGLTGGAPFHLVSRGMPTFIFVKNDSGVPTVIEVGGDALIENMSGRGPLTIKVGGNALIEDLKRITDACVQMEHALPAAEDLIEIQLCQPEVAGLYPLDLAMLVAHWPNRRTGLSLSFVNPAGHPITRAWVSHNEALCDLYRARLITVSPGYLTLISQGSSGNFYLMCPNPHGVGIGSLAGQSTCFFPGPELLDVSQLPLEEQEWVFGFPAGTERLLALLTPAPLWPQPMPVQSQLTEDALRELFNAARHTLGSEICLATVETSERH